MTPAAPPPQLAYLVQEAQDEGARLLVGVLLQDLRPRRAAGGRQRRPQGPELPLKLLQLLLQVDVGLTCRPAPAMRGGGAPRPHRGHLLFDLTATFEVRLTNSPLYGNVTNVSVPDPFQASERTKLRPNGGGGGAGGGLGLLGEETSGWMRGERS